MELRPNSFNSIAPVTKNLLIINGLIFLAEMVLNSSMPQLEITRQLALFHWDFEELFRPWQLLTHMFMHGDFTHLFLNMFMLWMFGNIIERRLGSKRFLMFYLLCGFGASIFYLSIESLVGATPIPMVGASGAIYGIIFAFAWLNPESELLLFFVLPVKAKWLILGLGAFSVYMGLQQIGSTGGGIAHFAHLGGMVAAFVIFKSWRIRYGR